MHVRNDNYDASSSLSVEILFSAKTGIRKLIYCAPFELHYNSCIRDVHFRWGDVEHTITIMQEKYEYVRNDNYDASSSLSVEILFSAKTGIRKLIYCAPFELHYNSCIRDVHFRWGDVEHTITIMQEKYEHGKSIIFYCHC